MKTAIIGVAAWLVAVSMASADVHLTMQNGHVSLVAKDATVRQILTEWARVGQTKIVNVERVPGGPVTLELIDVPESQALEVLLRTLSGYITAPRPVEAANLSRFDRIILMPTLAAARPATAQAAAAPPAPVFQQGPQFPAPAPMPAADDDNEEDRSGPIVAAPQVQLPRSPVFNTFPQASTVAPQTMPIPQQGGGAAQGQTPRPAGFPASPTAPFGGVAVPGMVAPPPPAPPGQQPGAPGQPVRRPGGPGGQ